MRYRLMAVAVATLMFIAPLPVVAQETTNLSPSTRTEAPNTDNCPHVQEPARARTTSEASAPHTTLPQPATPAGGERMAECGVITPADFVIPEDQVASAWMVIDLDSAEIIAAKDPHGRYRPASIIKALIALLALTELDPTKTINGTWEAANIEGSRVGVGEGGQYTIDQLIHGLLLASGNDAAFLLAQELGGDTATLEKVNALAQEIGTADTFVASYSGLDAPGMSTSAYDMALIYHYAWQNPDFAEILSTEYIDFPGWGDNPGFQVWNDNGLFLNDPDGIGGKTGYTDDANHTFVGAVDRDGRRLAAVLLDTTVDGGRPWQQAQKLIDAALAIPPGSGVGELEKLTSEPTITATPTPIPTQSNSPDDSINNSINSESIDIVKVVFPIAAIVLLLLAALAWTFGKRR